MKIFNKIKAHIIANYIIKQIKKISKTNTHNAYLRVNENIKKTKYIYIKFNLINGIKDINMNFIEYYDSLRKIDKNVYGLQSNSIFDCWKIYKKRLPRKLYKYLDLLSKRYDFNKPENVRKLAIMVLDNISKLGGYRLFDGSYVYNTIINTEINCYKITLKFI